MPKFEHPKPIDNEIILDPSKVILSKTDQKGIIQYGNDYFVSIAKYEIYEMMGKPHNIIRHPDMPKVIFKFMWERLYKGQNIYAVVKNLAKDGSFYWVMTSFKTTYDEYGNIDAHFARRKTVPIKAREVFENLYKKIIAIEKSSITAAENYFYGFVENSGMTYDELFLSVVGMNEEEITSYFESNELNINVTEENTVLEINKSQIKQFESSETNNESLVQSVEELKKQIEELKSALTQNPPKEKPKRGFFGRLFADDND